MRKVHNEARYEALQCALAKALVSSVHAELADLGLRKAQLREAVSRVAFSVACVYDGSTYVEAGEDYLVPILGFALGRTRDRLLIPEEGGSGVHEFVAGMVEELLAD